MSKPWFKDGLRFECTRCGACCTGEPGYVWVSDEELQAIAEFLDEPLEEVRAQYAKQARRGRTLREKANGDCVFYDFEGGGCKIYPVRPTQCRTWPFWESNVHSRKAWNETMEVCPGAGQGDLITVDEILARVKEIRL